MADLLRDLLGRAVDGPPAVPPPRLAARARRRWLRRRAAAVGAAAAAVVAVVLPTALLRPSDGPVTAPARPSGPSAVAFEDGALLAPVQLDGGRLLLEPYDGQAQHSREQAVADYRSAEAAYWADALAPDLEEHVVLARASSAEPGAVLDAAPAWVVVYRYRTVAFGCPMTTSTPRSDGPALGDDTRWRAFVLPLDGRPAVLWQGQGTGGCGPLDGPLVEPARRHSSAPWSETSRDQTTAVLAVGMPCLGTVDELRGPAQPSGEVQVVVSQPLSTSPLRCPRPADARSTVSLAEPGQRLTAAPTGVLGQRP